MFGDSRFNIDSRVHFLDYTINLFYLVGAEMTEKQGETVINQLTVIIMFLIGLFCVLVLK